ncbi:LysR family transcriptional regulator [Cohnella sp. LGH]|uniref:LysR family transcriptional regulator n=1 Tax=Cohnella sp. LGH TaxID=1619153 RepID=UPI001ADD1299|nr:LysR family transcriptional regulator [Cohnella sp. LGH]QTH45586.1 LysR family transcriptional regulator [Cohnella sp. LGH]
MQLQLLEYFQCIAKLGNFTKAAQELHIAQPALSKQMARLEAEIGAELFIRTGRGIKLTEAGNRLLFHCERILADWKIAARSIQDLGLSGRGFVRLAMYPTFVWYMLPHFLPEFVRDNDSIDLEIEQGLNEPILDWVLGHHMEAGIVTAPVHHPQLREQPLHVEEFGLLVPADHPWSGRDCVPLVELHQQPLILSTLNRWYESFILPLFKQLAIQPQVRLVVHQYDVIKELVRGNLGVSLVPVNAYRMWKKTETGIGNELAIVPIDPPLQRQLLWIERQDRTRSLACQRFLDYMIAYLNAAQSE